MKFTLFVLCATASLALPNPLARAVEGPREAAPLLERIVVAGASVSAGFGLHRETGSPTSFAQVFDATIRVEHGAVHSNAQYLFYIDPEGYGRLMIDEIKKLEPTLVVAIDFPFWFGYGVIPESQRLARAERGLRLLEELDCPVVVGNFPDMSPAAKGVMLHSSQVPAFDSLSELNAMIAEWAAAEPDRILVDLADHAERIRAKVDIPVGSGWEGKRATELLQADQLHPSLVGAALVAVMTAELLLESIEGLKPDTFDLDIERVAARVKSSRARELEDS